MPVDPTPELCTSSTVLAGRCTLPVEHSGPHRKEHYSWANAKDADAYFKRPGPNTP